MHKTSGYKGAILAQWRHLESNDVCAVVNGGWSYSIQSPPTKLSVSVSITN